MIQAREWASVWVFLPQIYRVAGLYLNHVNGKDTKTLTKCKGNSTQKAGGNSNDKGLVNQSYRRLIARVGLEPHDIQGMNLASYQLLYLAQTNIPNCPTFVNLKHSFHSIPGAKYLCFPDLPHQCGHGAPVDLCALGPVCHYGLVDDQLRPAQLGVA